MYIAVISCAFDLGRVEWTFLFQSNAVCMNQLVGPEANYRLRCSVLYFSTSRCLISWTWQTRHPAPCFRDHAPRDPSHSDLNGLPNSDEVPTERLDSDGDSSTTTTFRKDIVSTVGCCTTCKLDRKSSFPVVVESVQHLYSSKDDERTFCSGHQDETKAWGDCALEALG